MQKIYLAIGLAAAVGIIWFFVRESEDESVSPLPSGGITAVSGRVVPVKSPEEGGPETGWKPDERAIFEALVALRDQTDEDSTEDRKTSLKRGDVLAVRKSPHAWSETEAASYLIVKLELLGSEATALPHASRIDLDKAGFQGDHVLSGQPLLDRTFGKEIIIQK